MPLERPWHARAHQLEHGVLGAVALAGHDAGAAHQPRGQVVHDVAVEVGHHQDVELVGILHQLAREWEREWGTEAWDSCGEAQPHPGTGSRARAWWGWMSSECLQPKHSMLPAAAVVGLGSF